MDEPDQEINCKWNDVDLVGANLPKLVAYMAESFRKRARCTIIELMLCSLILRGRSPHASILAYISRIHDLTRLAGTPRYAMVISAAYLHQAE